MRNEESSWTIGRKPWDVLLSAIIQDDVYQRYSLGLLGKTVNDVHNLLAEFVCSFHSGSF